MHEMLSLKTPVYVDARITGALVSQSSQKAVKSSGISLLILAVQNWVSNTGNLSRKFVHGHRGSPVA